MSSAVKSFADLKTINDANKKIYEQTAELIRQNITGAASNTDFESKLTELANNWLTVNEGREKSVSAMITGQIISIGLKSCQWWRENAEELWDDEVTGTLKVQRGGPSTEMEPLYFLPVPVAMDAAGALISSCSVALNNYINTGSISWRAVGTGAVIGAVTGSTGLVGRVGRWLKSLF